MNAVVASLCITVGALLVALPLYEKARNRRNLHFLRAGPRYAIYKGALEDQRRELIRDLEYEVSIWRWWHVAAVTAGGLFMLAGALAFAI